MTSYVTEDEDGRLGLRHVDCPNPYQDGRQAFRDGAKYADLPLNLQTIGWLDELADHVRQIERYLGLITLPLKEDDE